MRRVAAGRGFGTRYPSGRVPLAHLDESGDRKIGRAMRRLIDAHLEYLDATSTNSLDETRVTQLYRRMKRYGAARRRPRNTLRNRADR